MISLLQADPDLESGLQPDQLKRARTDLLAPVADLPLGLWDPAALLQDRGAGALLVVDGLLLREVMLGGAISAELLGPGDVLECPGLEESDALIPVTVHWTAVETGRVVLLTPAVMFAAARWPAITRALFERLEQRVLRLSKQAAICHLNAVHLRLLALFWHLAERWGRMGTTEVILPLRLLHRTLAALVGAERSTVTLGLKRLADAGLVTRRNDGAWLLTGDPCDALDGLMRQSRRLPASKVPLESDGRPVTLADERLKAETHPWALRRAGLPPLGHPA